MCFIWQLIGFKYLHMKKTVLFFLSVLALFSCTNEQQKEVLMPTVNGGLGEIIMIMPNGVRETPLDDFIDSVFKADYAGLPQPEPLFDVYKVPPHGFTTTFQIHRNIMKIDIDPSYQSTELKLKKDVWAKPQLYVQLSAPSAEACLAFLQTEYPKVLGVFHKAERKRIEETYLKYVNTSANEYIRDNFGVNIRIPKSLQIEMKGDDFCWMGFMNRKKDIGLLVYSTPYTDKKQLTKDSLVAWRDSVLKKYVTSEIEGSHMQTDARLPVSFNRGRLIDSCFTTEIRGLWMMKNDFMGGPFVSYTVVDTLRNQLVTAEGFMYAPNQKKRNDVRRLEALLKSMELVPLKKEE